MMTAKILMIFAVIAIVSMKYIRSLPIAGKHLQMLQTQNNNLHIYMYFFSLYLYIYLYLYSHVDCEKASISFVNAMLDYKLAITQFPNAASMDRARFVAHISCVCVYMCSALLGN